MSVHKRIHRGNIDWYYQLSLAGDRIRKYGFATKKEAQAAEAVARAEEARKHGLANPADAPPTLDVMLENFFALHCTGAEDLMPLTSSYRERTGDDGLSPKTTQRYREQKLYLDGNLLAMPPAGISRTHWSAEWKRLLASGGHTRRDKTPRQLSAKTVQNIAGMVSSAYTWAANQGFVTENPVKYSNRPKVRKRRAVTVASLDLDLVLTADGSFWCRPEYLAAADALGSRRGEILALRWSDLRNGRFFIARNLIQTKDATGARRLEFKPTKGDEEHDVTIPASLVPVLEGLRKRQGEFKQQFGPS